MKQISLNKNVSAVELETILFTRTRTQAIINTTAINALALMLAANTVKLDKVNVLRQEIASNLFTETRTRKQVFAEEYAARTFTFAQVADFIVNKLHIVNASHKKDNSKLYIELASFTKDEILLDKSLTKKAIKITALRLRNHTSHHIFQTKVYESYFEMNMTNSDSFTVKDDMIALIQNQSVRSHVAALSKAMKQ